jgi:hypothetical protein
MKRQLFPEIVVGLFVALLIAIIACAEPHAHDRAIMQQDFPPLVWVDSTRHVACYKIAQSTGFSCVKVTP